MSRLGRFALAATAATALAIVVQQAPASAGVWFTDGPFSSQAQCQEIRAEYIDMGFLTQPCYYQSGWYFKHMQDY